jgi:hypothetical protein
VRRGLLFRLVPSLLLLGCEGDHAARAPVPPPAVHVLVPGPARLAGFGEGTACSHGVPAAGDGHRWCAFYRPAPDDPARSELWVADVTRAMTGAAAPCDGSDPGCLRMTDRLFTEFRFQSYSHPEAHRFEGDTLFFLGTEQPGGKARDRFEGHVWVWRPGWTQPRVLTSDRGVLCRGGGALPAAICVDGVNDVPRQFDLRAGAVVDRDDSVLPVVERITLPDDAFGWSGFFSPAGDLFAFSSQRAGESAETLRVVATAELGTAASRTVVPNGTAWTLARSGRGLFFIRDPSANGQVGALWSADFPSGDNVVELARGVFDFQVIGDEGVAFRTEIRGAEGVLHVVPDRRVPGQRFVLSADAHAWYPLAASRFAYILRSRQGEERGFVGDSASGSVCSLESRAGVTVFGASLLPNLGLVSWVEPSADASAPDVTLLGRPDDCGGKRVLGAGISLLQPVGARGLAFGTQDSAAIGAPVTMRYIAALDDRPVEDLATVVLDGVDAGNVSRAGAAPDALVLGTAAGGASTPGLFVFGPLAPR